MERTLDRTEREKYRKLAAVRIEIIEAVYNKYFFYKMVDFFHLLMVLFVFFPLADYFCSMLF